MDKFCKKTCCTVVRSVFSFYLPIASPTIAHLLPLSCCHAAAVMQLSRSKIFPGAPEKWLLCKLCISALAKLLHSDKLGASKK